MIYVGVTGHRFLAEVDKVVAGIEEAVSRISAAFPDQPLAVISPLAEGADRLVVRELLSYPNARLIVPLPFPADDYLTDFENSGSQAEFRRLLARADEVIDLPPQPTRKAAYEVVGRYVLDHCDVLLAVWDGQGEQGMGGTGAIVAEARRRGLPIAWVHAGNRRPGTNEPTTLGEDQGKVTFEGFEDGLFDTID